MSSGQLGTAFVFPNSSVFMYNGGEHAYTTNYPHDPINDVAVGGEISIYTISDTSMYC